MALDQLDREIGGVADLFWPNYAADYLAGKDA